jgi:hypothetical protein
MAVALGSCLVAACTSSQPAARGDASPVSGTTPVGATGRETSVPADREPVALARRDVCWSQGQPETSAAGPVRVRAPQTRGLIAGSAGERATLRFVHRGATEGQARLGSGEVRQQLALKLRARDTCNVLYASWRLSPTVAIVVSEKANPNRTRHDQCGNGGYRTLRPTWSQPPPVPRAGGVHELSARIDGGELRVSVDGQLVWRGSVAPVPSSAPPLGSGLRSDNWSFELLGVDADGDAAASSPCGDLPHDAAP